MKIIQNNKSLISFSNFGQFTNDDSNMVLVDIINDATKENSTGNFTQSPGAFVYELDLTVNTQKIHLLDIEGIQVKIYSENPSKSPFQNPSAKGEELKKQNDALKEFLDNQIKPIFEVEIPLTANLAYKTQTTDSTGNFVASRRADGSLSLSGFEFKEPPLSPKPTLHDIYFANNPKTSGKLVAAKITSTPSNVYTSLGVVNTNATSLMKEAIKTNLPLSDILNNPIPAYPTIGASNSLAMGKNEFNPKLEESQLFALDNIVIRKSLTNIREGLKEEPVCNKITYMLASKLSGNGSLESSNSSTLGYKAVIESFENRIRRRIEITKDILGARDKFFVELVPIVKQKEDKEMQNIALTKSDVFTVSHRVQMMEMLEPTIAPKITMIKNTIGNVVLKVSQQDPSGAGIKILREHSSPRSGWQTFSKDIVGNISITENKKSYVIVDSTVQNIYPIKTTYTAISTGNGGKLGPSKSIIIDGINSPNINATENNDTLSIIAKNEKDRVKIQVTNIPDDIISIQLFREDVSNLSNRIKKIKSQQQDTMVIVNEQTDVTFYDYSATSGRPCKYFCIMRPRFGSEFRSSEEEDFIRKRPEKPLPVDAIITNESLSGLKNAYSFEMDIVVTPRNDNIDFILKTLEKAGVSSVFLQEIEKQRSSFADLAVFIVERINRVTGKRVSFGIQPPGTFKDSPDIRSSLGIPEIQNDCRYSYYVKLCLRSPEALMKSVFAKFSNSKVPGVDNQEALTQKFMSIYADQFGNSPGGALPSSADLIKGISISDNLRAGETGITLETDLVTPESKPAPSNLRGIKLPNGNVKLTWSSTPGDVRSIKLSLIFVTIMGEETCIGFIINDGQAGTYSYTDSNFGSTPGTISYTVKYIYQDLTVSEYSNRYSLINISYTPPALVDAGIIRGIV